MYARVCQSMPYSGILWHTLAYSGILWHTLAYSGILLHTLAYSGILWHTLAYSCIHFVDFYDLRTFVTIYILSRFTHFFRKFFLAKIAFSATSHVFCMYAISGNHVPAFHTIHPILFVSIP